jgi:two-component system sensor kinase FixL
VLNQPITPLILNAQAGLRFMASDPPDLSELQPLLRDIVAANARAAEIIRSLRVFLKKEEQPQFRALDVASLIGDVVTLVHSDAVTQDVRVEVDLEPDLPELQGDRVQLQQVLLNILLNAFDAMKGCPSDRRTVTISARRDGTAVRVAVSDRGHGLSSGALDKIFQPFYTTKPDGLGMGLSICRAIIEVHGGSLTANNNAHGGATFWFVVPADSRAERADRLVGGTVTK